MQPSAGTPAPVISVHTVPLYLCHFIVLAPPPAVMLKDADVPWHTPVLAGFVVNGELKN